MDILKMRDLLNQGKTIYDLPLKVTSYSRVSTDLITQKTSFSTQKSYYEDLITNSSNWTYIDGYADDGITGRNTCKRDDFHNMVEDGLKGKFDLIITKEVSRFARNTLDSIYYTRELLKNGVAVYFESDNINTLYPDSEFKLTIMASLAQEESRKTSQRVKWAKKRAIEQGKVIMPPNTHGYKLIDGKVEIVEDEAIFVKKIFELYCEGLGFRRLSRELAKSGYFNKNGNIYSYSTLRNILTNPRYKGYYTGGRTETVDYITGKVVHKDQSEWVMYPAPDVIPPIVSEKIWDKANKLLKYKRKKVYLKHETSYQNKYKYSGKIYCKTHDVVFHRTLYRYKTQPNREVYQCRKYRYGGKKACDSPTLYTEEIDKVMSEVFKEIFNQKERFINDLLEMVEKHLQKDDFTKDITKIMGNIEKINNRKNKLLDLVLNDLVSRNEFKERNDEFNKQLDLLEEELNRYEELRKTKIDVKSQLKLMKEFLSKEYDLDNNMPKELIEVFVDRIYVDVDKIDNTLLFEINLKTGQEVPVFYIKDIILYLTTHVDKGKMMFSFPRIKNSQEVEPIEVKVTDINLKVIV